MESLQRDGPARVKALDAFRLPVRQNNNTCFCTVSRPTADINFYPLPPKKKQKQKQNKLFIVSEKPDETRGGGVMPKRIFIGILSDQKAPMTYLISIISIPK